MSQGETATTSASAESEPGSEAAERLHQWVRGGRSFSGQERNCVFLNTGGSRFADVSAPSGLDYADDDRGIGLCDWDHDGKIDLWISNRNGPQLKLLANRSQNSRRHVGLKLVGTRCNRDAIGARVEVHVPGAKSNRIVKTLRAGDGFLSQSTKWLHFGLGDTEKIERVVVRWPGGQAEDFADVAVDGRFVLIEGAGKARPVPERPKVELPAAPQIVPTSSETARIWLAARPALPRLQYTAWDGGQGQVQLSSGRPIVIGLWSMTCGPCVAELREWSGEANAIRKAGLDLLALCVDGIADAEPTSHLKARELLEQIGFPFLSGRATSDMLDKLQLVHDQVLDRHRPIPVPMTVLIDTEGRLAAIYKGRVSTAQLIEDAARLNRDREDRRRDSVPLAGRWTGPGRELRPVNLAAKLVEHGFVSDAAELAERLSLSGDADAKYALLAARIGNELFNRGDTKSAIERYREAIALEPNLAVARMNLAVALLSQRDVLGAEVELRAAIRAKPDYDNARIHLATLLTQTRRQDEALAELEQVLQAKPNHPRANVALGRILLQRGQAAAAALRLERAVQTSPEEAEPWGMLGMIRVSQGRQRDAAACFEKALERRPGWALAADQLAWLLATASDASIRNPRRAIELAEKTLGDKGEFGARLMDTLAAAYAADGRFEEGVKMAERALEIATRAGDRSLTTALRQRIELYKERKSFVTKAVP